MINKKNGFISISIIYSFFVVFMLLLVLIMSSYVNNRTSLTIYKNDIKTRIAKNSNRLAIAYNDFDVNNHAIISNNYRYKTLSINTYPNSNN